MPVRPNRILSAGAVAFALAGDVRAGDPGSPAGTLVLDARGGFDSYHNLATGAGFAQFRGLAQAEGFSLTPRGSFRGDDLQGATALALLQPFSPGDAYASEEIVAIRAFVDGGGRLLVLAEGGTGSSAAFVNVLGASFGVAFADTPSEALGATIDQFVPHALTAGLSVVSVDYQRRLTVSAPAVDLTAASGAADFLAVSGRAVFVADSNPFLEADGLSDASLADGSNERLARNILHFLATPSLPPASQVVGRAVFYNRSVWDGNNEAATAADDAAVATDKSALRPGQKATFANYTSYSRGLNGLAIDVDRLPGTPTAADFLFHAGNTPDPGTWPAAPAPASVVIRPGAGAGGSDRILLAWGTEVVRKAWLRVTVLATAATGLAAPDVFYFGNAVGETGNSVADARVTAADALRVLGHVTASAAIGDPYDVNRDGRVGAADRLLVLGNLSALSPLILLDLTGLGGDRRGPAGDSGFAGETRRAPAAWAEPVSLAPIVDPPGATYSGPSPAGLQIEARTGGQIELRWLGAGGNGGEAVLETSTDGVRWEKAGAWSKRSGEGGPGWVGTILAAEPCRFFRVIGLPGH
jgi:hypothetical protein